MLEPPPLTSKQKKDLAGPFDLEMSYETAQYLRFHIDLEAFYLALFFHDPRERDETRERLDDEIKKIAVDPARALGLPAENDEADFAHAMLSVFGAKFGFNPETRSGAADIGNLADRLLNDKCRVDGLARFAIDVVFSKILRDAEFLAPGSTEKWPSNDNPEAPITFFAMAYIEILLDRLSAYLPTPSAHSQKWIDNLLKKDHRSILDGLRKARKKARKGRV